MYRIRKPTRNSYFKAKANGLKSLPFHKRKGSQRWSDTMLNRKESWSRVVKASLINRNWQDKFNNDIVFPSYWEGNWPSTCKRLTFLYLEFWFLMIALSYDTFLWQALTGRRSGSLSVWRNYPIKKRKKQ